jgi:hypothetical protein
MEKGDNIMKKKSMFLKAGSIIVCSTLFSCSQNNDSNGVAPEGSQTPPATNQ